MITARKALECLDEGQINLKQWVQPLVAENNAQAIKDPRLDAPNDVILKLARFALSCTATPVATRPSMARILSDLIAMKEEFLGPDQDPLVVRIDSDLENRRGPTFSQEIRRANAVASEWEGGSGMSVGMGSIGEMESVDSGTLVVRIDSDLENRRGPRFSREIRRAEEVASGQGDGASVSSGAMGSSGVVPSPHCCIRSRGMADPFPPTAAPAAGGGRGEKGGEEGGGGGGGGAGAAGPLPPLPHPQQGDGKSPSPPLLYPQQGEFPPPLPAIPMEGGEGGGGGAARATEGHAGRRNPLLPPPHPPWRNRAPGPRLGAAGREGPWLGATEPGAGQVRGRALGRNGAGRWAGTGPAAGQVRGQALSRDWAGRWAGTWPGAGQEWGQALGRDWAGRWAGTGPGAGQVLGRSLGRYGAGRWAGTGPGAGQVRGRALGRYGAGRWAGTGPGAGRGMGPGAGLGTGPGAGKRRGRVLGEGRGQARAWYGPGAG
ncbi:unnamed protein product [Closterium sp. Naga37s-1]|nr:unnamed protein product [Closterium sp. Naga37s-1]